MKISVFYLKKDAVYQKKIYSVFLSVAVICNMIRVESDNCSIYVLTMEQAAVFALR